MEGDPTSGASVDTTADSDAAIDASDALPSEPTAEASDVAERESDDATETQQTPTPEDDTSEEAGDAEGDESTEASEGETQLSRRERQRLREQERINAAVADALAAREREAQTAAEQQRQQAEAQQAAEQARAEYVEYLGAPGESERLTAEVADLTRQIRAEWQNPQGADIDALEAEIVGKETRLGQIAAGKRHHTTISREVWGEIGSDFASAKEFPELAADPAVAAKYDRGGETGSIRGALGVLRDAVIAAKDAERASEIASIRDAHTKQMKAVESDRNAWRARAGGAEVVDTTSGSTGNGAGGSTIDRLIREAGSVEEYVERAKRGDYSRINLSG